MRPAILPETRTLSRAKAMTRHGDSDGETKGGQGSPPGASPIPDKLYFRIGEVAALCRVPTHVLRFWQTEFAQLQPGKSGTGQRLYRRRDVEMALRIKRLLHDEGYTIAGARGVLAGHAALPAALSQPAPPVAAHKDHEPQQAVLTTVRDELRALLRLLDRESARADDPRKGP